MKKIFLLTFIICCLFVFTSNTYAQTHTLNTQLNSNLENVGTSANRLMKNASSSANIKSASLKERALSEIERRLTALNALITKITNLKKINDTQKAKLTSLITSEITSLESLKAKIEAYDDNTVSTDLKTDTKSIVTSHRIFAFFMPMVRLLTAAEMLSTTSQNMEIIVQKLQERINMLPSGTQKTNAQNSLQNIIKNINNAKENSEKIITSVSSLSAEGYPANKTELKAAQSDLKEGLSNLYMAAKEIRSIVSLLKNTEIITSPTP